MSNETMYDDYERAKTEESIAKNEGNIKIANAVTSEAAYEVQEVEDAKNLLLIEYVYNNSLENKSDSFDVKIGDEIVTADVNNGKIGAMVKGVYIEAAISKKIADSKIDKDTRDHLAKHYENTMFLYGNMYYLLQRSLGKAKQISYKDLSSGDKMPLFHENMKPVSSSLRCVTPMTSVEIEFVDKYGKPLILILPGVKNVERAIEKVKIGGKYHTAYENETESIRIKHAVKNSRFVPELKSFISKQKGDKSIENEIDALDWRYSEAVSFYLAELKKIRFPDKDKKEELKYRKRIHEIETTVKNGSAQVLDVMKEVYDIAIDVAKYDMRMKDYFYKLPLFSRYLIELEDIFSGQDDKKENKSEKNKARQSKHEELLQVYYKLLGGDSEYISEMSKVSRTHERLRDIYRCSITTNYYDNITYLKSCFDEVMSTVYNSDKFYGNTSPRHKGFEKSQGYRDDKVIYKKKDKAGGFNIAFETQFKIGILGEEDSATHKIYEEIRALEEGLRDCFDTKKVAEIKSLIIAKKLEIKSIYGKVLKKYNNKVLETAAEMEVELFRKEWKGKLNIPKDLETLKKLNEDRTAAENSLKHGSKTHPAVGKFLRDNLLVSPFEALNFKEDITNIEDIKYDKDNLKDKKKDVESYMIIMDEVKTKADMKSFARRYYHIIEAVYIGVYRGELEEGYFDDYDKALAERQEQMSNSKILKSSKYAASLSRAERRIINKEERDYLKFAGKERVAETPKKVNNDAVTLKQKLDTRGK
ncbi:MAG: hypothetical protein LBR70_05715 [Lactobacillaceae bacterium]|jgi:hypothetical protein|nr:hypothetical protein [Lactobacillaceae bacterium]